MAQPKVSSLLIQLADAAPTLGLLIVIFVTGDLVKASWVTIVLSALALALGLVLERRIRPIPAFSGVLALVFGGLAIVLHRGDLLQMKMTVVDGALAAILFAGILLKRNPLKMLLGGTMSLPDDAWRVLTIRYGLFFVCSAIANEIVRRTQTPQVWGVFKMASIGASILFGAAQFPLLRKFLHDPAAAEAPEPPEPGF
jgi:intracellular septation protein